MVGMRAGRHKHPVVGQGPIKELAKKLQDLRAAAGSPTYKEMAARVHVSDTSLSQADNGRNLPTEPMFHAYLDALGDIDPGDRATCEELYASARTNTEPDSTISVPAAASPVETPAPSIEPVASPVETVAESPPRASALPLAPATPLVPPMPQPAIPGELGGPVVDRIPRSRLQVALGATALLALVGGMVIGAKLAAPTGAGTPTGTHPSGPALTSTRPAMSMPAHLTLDQLAQKTITVADPPSSGRYTYLREWSWVRDTNSPDTTEPYTVNDEQLWWAEDNSGKRVTIANPESNHPEPPYVQTFPVGDLKNPVDPPAELDAILAGQLTPPGAAGPSPAGAIRMVAEVYQYRVPRPAQRAAILRVLSNTPGITTEGQGRDRMDRLGLVVSAVSDNGTTRDVLIFDPGSGFLLSYERDTTTPPSHVPFALTYRLYLDHTYRNTLD
jgi:hypothetical protein